MAIKEEKKKIIERCVLRLVKKNLNTFHMVGSAIKSLFSGSFNKRLVSKVLGFDSGSELPVDDLVAKALLNGLEEDIEEIF
ncbi:MAG TPA: hypothetical protein VFG02_09630, partial [Nitrospirota bacterium]|nr:hypothetical protein [Nitrospirota bacterium]